MEPKVCPNCNRSFEEELILDNFKKQRDNGIDFFQKTDEEIEAEVIQFYGSLEARFSSVIGIEDARKYDCISYWKCPFCDYTWDRFTSEEVHI